MYSFPREYPINKECVWEIIAPENHKITLNFTHFDLEGNAFYQPAACEYDAGELCVLNEYDEKNANVWRHEKLNLLRHDTKKKNKKL